MDVFPRLIACIFAFFLLGNSSTRAQVIVFDNSSDFSGETYFSTNQYGDEVELAGTARVVTRFLFEYEARFQSQGDEFARLRFYANNGPAWQGNPEFPTPGSPPLWELDFTLVDGYQTVSVEVPEIVVPDTFTWTVEFFGLTMKSNDYAGLLFYGRPTVGDSFDDFWELLPNGWASLFRRDVPKNNFAARIFAIEQPTPPPALAIALQSGSVRITWPDSPFDLTLQSKASADPQASWSVVAATPAFVGDEWQVVLPIQPGNRIFRLTSNPDPGLDIALVGASIRLRWPATATGYTLQSKPVISPGTWTNLPTPTTRTGDYFEATFPIAAGNQFFRLAK